MANYYTDHPEIGFHLNHPLMRRVAELKERGKFYRVTAAGQREARPHDITITKEAPNYRT